MGLATVKKGDTVILHMFTGIAVGVKEVLAADKSTVTLETRIGKAKFSRKSGKQIEPKAKNERFANYITEDDGSYVPTRRRSKKTTKKAKKADPEPELYDDDEDEEEEQPTPKKKVTKKRAVKDTPTKKKASDKPTKKAKKKAVEVDFEDIDEEEYEEEE